MWTLKYSLKFFKLLFFLSGYFGYIELYDGVTALPDSESTFTCDGGNRTIPLNETCNKYHDCIDWTDESVQACGACNYTKWYGFITMFTCANGLCIPYFDVCNGFNNCGDWSDEEKTTPCQCMYLFKCDNGRCLAPSKKCDGVNDCGDFSDEYFNVCSTMSRHCTGYNARCHNYKCMDLSDICNGRNDCGDMSDEQECYTCKGNEWMCPDNKCIPKSWICDGYEDCAGDEYNCTCPQDTFRCGSGECIEYSALCDGITNCKDRSDENGCGYMPYIRGGNDTEIKYHKINKLVVYDIITESDTKIKQSKPDQATWSSPGHFTSKRTKESTPAVTRENKKSRETTKNKNFKNTKSTQAQTVNKDISTEIYPSMSMSTDIPNPNSCPMGTYGYQCKYDCHCKGVCHPRTGECPGGCVDNWSGQTCQIVNISLTNPEQLFGNDIIDVSASIDGNISSCPLSAFNFGHTWWRVNLTTPMDIHRIRIYNKKDTSLLEPLTRWTSKVGCEYNPDYKDNGIMDITCPNATITDSIVIDIEYTKVTLPVQFQICEIQIILCSNHSYGPQCEYTCNCENGAACDDITGECSGDCQAGWTSDSCGPTKICKFGEFQCGDGYCIPNIFLCDHVNDCPDRSDESPERCDTACYNQYEFECSKDGQCVPWDRLCNHINDCYNGADESLLRCPVKHTTYCYSGEFKCHYGKCIQDSWKCDGMDDCGDNSDERNCSATPVYDLCLFRFQCSSGKCINRNLKCDGSDDCGDNSDELFCPVCDYDQLECDNGNCVYTRYKCDGADDCGDNSDEKGCDSSDSHSYAYAVPISCASVTLIVIISLISVMYFRRRKGTRITITRNVQKNMTTLNLITAANETTKSTTGTYGDGIDNKAFVAEQPS